MQSQPFKESFVPYAEVGRAIVDEELTATSVFADDLHAVVLLLQQYYIF